MTSLSQQLSSISQANQTLALDRKKRSKIHSISFLYDPYHAATQDYESIFAESIEALDKLESLDSRFHKFRSTIFNETSIQIDRQVQSKEQIENLNKTINAFVELLGQYWNLAIAVKVAEWPLRRFQMNYHNAESLLLSTLPYFDQPVFERVLYVIPKNQIPTMFSWLTNFKTHLQQQQQDGKLKLPSRESLIKVFHDVSFFQLYQNYLAQSITHKTQHRKQLVFFISMTISTLASLSSTSSAKLAELVPLALQISGSLLSSQNSECLVSAYTILAVLSSAVPLSRDVVLASIETILVHLPKHSELNLLLQSMTCALKLYQTVQSGALETLPCSIVDKLPKSLLGDESDSDAQGEFLKLIKSSRFNNKFVCAYLRSNVVNGVPISKKLLNELKDFQFSKTQLQILLTEILKKINDTKTVSDPAVFADVLKFIIEKNKEAFLETLQKLEMSIDQLEMLLQTTLIDHTSDVSQDEDSKGDDIIVDVENSTEETSEELLEQFKAANSTTPSFLYATKVVDEDFLKLQSLFLKSIQQRATQQFLVSCFNNNTDSQISFLLRVATSLNTPLKGRTTALLLLKKSIEKLDSKIHTYTIVPILVTLLISNLPKIRSLTGEVLKTIHARPVTKSKKFLLAETMYGEKRSPNIALLSPKDADLLLTKIVESLTSLQLDPQLFHQQFNELIGNKKLGKVTLAFFASHANANNIPSVKMDAMNIVVKGASELKGVAAPSQLFEHFLDRYLTKRSVWIIRCDETGCDFAKFEKQVVGLITAGEKHVTGIKFLKDCLNSGYQSLVDCVSEHIIEIFGTLKMEFQLSLVDDIIETGLKEGDSDSDLVLFDPLELLESLPISNGIFAHIFKNCSLTSTSSMPTGQPIAKRRRRSSASTKQAMKETEVSNLASTHLKKITLLLDVLQKYTTSSEFVPSYELVRLLINILDDLETLGKDGKLPILYSQETLATCLSNIITALNEGDETAKIDNSTIRADVIVSAIRSSDSPQVQNKLLLVVSALAALSPELVLHSVMPIFTFMGAHTVRQDDEFSNHVVEQTIQCVVPALAQSSESCDVREEVEFLLASFTSAFLHIPRHRRVSLFTTLSKTLGSELSIHLVLFLVGQQYVASSLKNKMGDCSAILDFASVFIQKFKPHEQLEATIKFLKLWDELPEDLVTKDSPQFKKLVSKVIFGPSIVSLGKEEFLAYRSGMLTFIRHALVDLKSSAGIPRLRLKVATQIMENENVDELLASFASIVELILSRIDQYHMKSSEDDDEVLDKFYELLGDVLSLLPVEEFVKSICAILKSEDSSLRTKSHITILTASKFELERIDDPFAQEGIATLTPMLLENVTSEQSIELSQSSLDAMASIFQRFKDRIDSKLLMKVLGIVTGKSGLLSQTPEIIISSINCITAIVTVVGVKMIGMFPKIVTPLYKIFAKTQEQDEDEDSDSSKLIQISILVLISSLAQSIPTFLAPPLKEIFQTIFAANLVPNSIRTSVLNVIVDNIDLKTVLNSLCSQWKFVSGLDSSSIGLFLSTLEQTIDQMEKKQVINQANIFVNFLLQALEYRAVSQFDSNTIHRVGASVYKCGLQYVMKLNDKSFRPLFASIVRWAFDGEDQSSPHTTLTF
ncbi:unnamed protein product [Ambrosiozyma monospora]|uniref:Unnamed protein product n=1 Tax=Ambrosiozyma monospora TaxID=43982 RepID=A0ACB5SSG0_AMBMO|nr:unnamed protein product [Ambrosiozyma monospora]